MTKVIHYEQMRSLSALTLNWVRALLIFIDIESEDHLYGQNVGHYTKK